MKKDADILRLRICANVKKLATARGWTRVELAQKSGVSYRTVLDIISGTASLRDTTIWKLAKAFGVHPGDLESEEIPLTVSAPDAPSPSAKPASRKPAITTGQAIRYLSEQFCVSEHELLATLANLMRTPAENGKGG